MRDIREGVANPIHTLLIFVGTGVVGPCQHTEGLSAVEGDESAQAPSV